MTATGDMAALHAAVNADPGDDTLRLIYADALEESGDRVAATWVRLSVRVASLPGRCGKMLRGPGLFPVRVDTPLSDRPTDPRYFVPRCRCEVCTARRRWWHHWAHHWCGREVEFRRPVAEDWVLRYVAGDRTAADDRRESWTLSWDRGLVGAIACPLAHWLRWGKRHTTHPLSCLTRVVLTDREPHERRGEWWWYDPDPSIGDRPDSWRGDMASLPTELFLHIPGAKHGYGSEFPTRAAAINTLSAAALAWAWSAPPAVQVNGTG